MNLLITGAWQQATDYFDAIGSLGNNILFLQQEKEELPCDPAWIEGVICNGLFLNHPIGQFCNLKYIQLTSAGFDRVPMDYVNAHGITIKNARGVYSIPMAEFAVASVLNIYKRLECFRANQKTHKWVKSRKLKELYGNTVAIVGCGSVGTECAKRFKSFGCTIIGIDVVVRNDDIFDCILPLDELDTVLSKADVVVLTLPLTESTKGLIDARRLSLIRGVLVNIARGAIIDQQALEAWDGEAVIDVFEDEPLQENSPLWDKAGFIVTPHNSFIGNGNGERLSSLIMGNLRSITKGQIEKMASIHRRSVETSV